VRRGLLTGTASTAAANGWAIAVALVTTPLLLSGLGAESFGIWALLQTFSALTGWLSLLDLGLGISLTRSIAARLAAEDRPAAGIVASTGLWLVAAAAVLGAAAAAAVALAVLAIWQPADQPDALTVVVVCFAAQAVAELMSSAMSSVLEGFQRVERSRGLDIVRRTAVLGSQTAVAMATGELVATVAAGAAASALVTVLIATVVRGEGVRARYERTAARELARYGRTVSALRPIGILQRSMDRLLVGIVLGPVAVVPVELATQIQNGAHAVMTSTSYAVLPGAAFLHAAEDRDRLRRLVEVGTRFVLLATWPVAALAMVLSPALIDVWVGPDYAEAAGLAVVALAHLLVVSPLQVGANMLLGTGRAGTNLRVMSIGIVVNLVSSVILVNWIGTVGTFLGTLLTSLVIFPLFLAAIAADIGVAPVAFVRESMAPVVAPTLVGAAVAGAIVAGADLRPLTTLVIAGLAGFAAYAATALRWGVDRDELRRALGSVVGRAG
jgi:O-antigen/teichoic acid export membrane protein